MKGDGRGGSRLAAGEQGAALVAIVAAVVVEGYLDIGLYEGTFSGQAEAEVLDAEAAGKPLLFVVGADGEV